MEKKSDPLLQVNMIVKIYANLHLRVLMYAVRCIVGLVTL